MISPLGQASAWRYIFRAAASTTLAKVSVPFQENAPQASRPSQGSALRLKDRLDRSGTVSTWKYNPMLLKHKKRISSYAWALASAVSLVSQEGDRLCARSLSLRTFQRPRMTINGLSRGVTALREAGTAVTVGPRTSAAPTLNSEYLRSAITSNAAGMTSSYQLLFWFCSWESVVAFQVLVQNVHKAKCRIFLGKTHAL